MAAVKATTTNKQLKFDNVFWLKLQINFLSFTHRILGKQQITSAIWTGHTLSICQLYGICVAYYAI